MFYSTICLIIKNDHNYIDEWINYHIDIAGFEHIYLYDNNSNPPLKEQLSKSKHHDKITYHFTSEIKPQIKVYNDCIQRYFNDARWIAFIDSDEFIVLKKQPQKIRDFLLPFENFAGVVINWYIFGSNGHTTKQNSILPNYTKRLKYSCHFKSIINPKIIKENNSFMSVHAPIFTNPNFFVVDENKNKIVSGYTQEQNTQSIQLNHYLLRSREDWKEKMQRGWADGNFVKDWLFFDFYDNRAIETDDFILSLLPK